jgi:enamine deaminase RidA (YjgF/YER057c/UK114 family)
MATIEKYGAPGVYEPAGYSQAIKVTGPSTILFTAGQVPYDADGGVGTAATSRRKRARCSAASKRWSRPAAARWRTS